MYLLTLHLSSCTHTPQRPTREGCEELARRYEEQAKLALSQAQIIKSHSCLTVAKALRAYWDVELGGTRSEVEMNNNAGWATEKNIARMTALYNAGHGAKGIGERMGLSKGTVAGMLNRLNLRRDDPLINAPHVTEFWTGAAPAWNTPDADGLFALMWDKGVRTTEIQEFFGITQEQRRTARIRLQLTPRDPKTSVRRRIETREAVVKPKPVVDRPVTSTRANGRSGVQTIGGIDWHAVNLCPKPVWRVGQCRWPLRCEEPAAGRFCTEHAGLLARKAA